MLANPSVLLSAAEQNLKQVDEDNIMQQWAESYEIGSTTCMVKGSGQRGWASLIIVEDKATSMRLGHVSCHGKGCEGAFREAMRIMETLQARFAASGAGPAREALYTAWRHGRDEHVAEHGSVDCRLRGNVRACRRWFVGA